MVRMSDILKNLGDSGEEKEKPRKKKPFSQPRPEEREKIKAPPKKKEEKGRSPEVRISPVVMKEAGIISSDDTEKLYEETLSLMEKTLKKDNLADDKAIDMHKITAQTERIVDHLKSGNEELIKLALIKNPTDTHKGYLIYHSLNSCIFAIKIGLGMRYERPELIELGISALLHDIGMTKYLHLAAQPKKLLAREHNEIKNHPMEGSRSVDKNKNIPKEAVYVIEQHHERIDGSGYPKNLKKDAINKYARILNVTDVFEAMLHPRSYRDRYSSVETIQEILKDKKRFDNKVIKILIRNIGIFPPGALVELNTKELAVVAKANPRSPFRPVVDILANAYGEKLKETKKVNLAAERNIYIARAK